MTKEKIKKKRKEYPKNRNSPKRPVNISIIEWQEVIFNDTEKKIKYWRPTSFDPKFTDELMEYFNIESNKEVETITRWKNDYEKIEIKEIANNLPTIQWFCRKLWIDRVTLYNWLKDAKNWKIIENNDWEKIIIYDKEKVNFLNTFKICQEIQQQIRMENSLKWLYNPSFAIFFWKNVFKWKDTSEVNQNTKVEVVKVKLPSSEEEVEEHKENDQDLLWSWDNETTDLINNI